MISSNTPEELVTNFNGTIFSTNNDINPDASPYVGPTGTLTITGNILSNDFNTITPSLENTSDYYFPKEFRPYIFQLPKFPGSNYWFGPGVPVTDLIDEIEPIRQIGSESNDVILRSIFNRAIKAINEQKQFEIYPFYHIKVKGIRT
jgi:hypothetical protein